MEKWNQWLRFLAFRNGFWLDIYVVVVVQNHGVSMSFNRLVNGFELMRVYLLRINARLHTKNKCASIALDKKEGIFFIDARMSNDVLLLINLL